MKNQLRLIVLSVLLPFATFSQYSISGSIQDSLKNSIVGARITILETYVGALSNSDGSYKLSGLTNGVYTVVADQLGFETLKQNIIISGADVKLDFRLEKTVVSLD